MIPHGYEVSMCGQVWAAPKVDASGKHRARRLLQPTLRRGYPRVTLVTAEGRKHIDVHTLVASAFLGPRPPGHTPDHKDRDRSNNRVTNLRWASRSEQALNSDFSKRLLRPRDTTGRFV